MKLPSISPIHGWRAFLGEVGIIVIGVLIALGAQQVAEDWQWRQRTGAARDGIAREIGVMTNQAFERLVVQRCLTNRLALLARQLEESGPEWQGAEERFIDSRRFFANVLPVAYRPPRRDLVDAIWVNVQNDGTLGHLRADEAEAIAAVYANAPTIQSLFEQEQELAARLGPLARRRTVTPEDRIHFLQMVYGLDRLNSSVLFAAKRLINGAGRLELPYDRAAIRQGRRDFIDQQRGYRGRCAEAPPLDMGFDGARKSERDSALR